EWARSTIADGSDKGAPTNQTLKLMFKVTPAFVPIGSMESTASRRQRAVRSSNTSPIDHGRADRSNKAGGIMKRGDRRRPHVMARAWCYATAVVAALFFVTVPAPMASAGCQCGKTWPHLFCRDHYSVGPGAFSNLDSGGFWYWMRSPEQ